MSMNIVPHTTGMKKFLSIHKLEDDTPYRPAILLFGKLWEFDICYANEEDAYKKAGEIADALENQVRENILALQRTHSMAKLSFDKEGNVSVRLPPIEPTLKKLYQEVAGLTDADQIP